MECLIAAEVPLKYVYSAAAADPTALGTRWVAELDRYGLTRAALIASIPGDEQSVSLATDTHRGPMHLATPVGCPDGAGKRAEG